MARDLLCKADQKRTCQVIGDFAEPDARGMILAAMTAPEHILRLLCKTRLEDGEADILKTNLGKANTAIMLKVLRHPRFHGSARIGLGFPALGEGAHTLPSRYGVHMDLMITMGKEVGAFTDGKGPVITHSVNTRMELLARSYTDIGRFAPQLMLVTPESLVPEIDPKPYTIGLCYAFQAGDFTARRDVAERVSEIITEAEG